MSDSSEDEDLSKFREAVDTSFSNLIGESRTSEQKEKAKAPNVAKSERYLEIASHYNDVKVPEKLQRQIGAKVSQVISKNIKFVEVSHNGIKKPKIKGGVKLFKDSEAYLSAEAPEDTYTDQHNRESKKINAMKRKQTENDLVDDHEKIKMAAVSGEYILSKEETKCWKSRRKEKLFKYKSNGKSKLLTAVE